MADKPIFALDAEGKWQLAYDDLQWILQYRSPKSGKTRSVSFIATYRRVLLEVLHDKGVLLTEEADRLNGLPDITGAGRDEFCRAAAGGTFGFRGKAGA